MEWMIPAEPQSSISPSQETHMEPVLWVVACTFMRAEHSDVESGIAVGRYPGDHVIETILDKDGKVVPAPVWTYNLKNYKGSIIINVRQP